MTTDPGFAPADTWPPPPVPMLPLCVNCSHYEHVKTARNPLYSISPHICHAFVDLVTGEPAALPAREMREKNGRCGWFGTRFEAYVKGDA